MDHRSKIMLVDDNHAMLTLLEYYLHNASYKAVHCFMDPKKAAEELINVAETDDRYDLVLCDWRMPLLSGYEVLKELRAIEDIEYTKFVMLTCETDPRQVELAIKEGADGFIIKPFTEEDFVAKVGEFLKDPEERNPYRSIKNFEKQAQNE